MANFIKIKSICRYITKETCTTLVIILCMSHLDYSNALLYSLPKKTIRSYQVIQNMCAKLVLGRPKYSSSTKALKCLQWLPVQWRITYKIGLLTFKCINKVAPRYLQELITIRRPAQDNMRSNTIGPILELPKIKHKTCAARLIQICCTKNIEFSPRTNKNV